MSTAELPKQSMALKCQRAWHAVVERRASIAWLASAAILIFAGFACTGIQTRDSGQDATLYATHVRALIAALWSMAVSNVLLAMNKHEEHWHLASWVTVTAVWYVILALT